MSEVINGNFDRLKELAQAVPTDYGTIEISDGIELRFKTSLSLQERTEFITYVLEKAVDDNGCISPLRLKTFFNFGILKFYYEMNFEDQDVLDIYDWLVQKGVFGICWDDELWDDVVENAADFARYNNSFAGMMSVANNQAGDLGTQLQDILGKIQSGEGFEFLKQIQDINNGQN